MLFAFMIPTYNAIDLREVISEADGHTKPWVVLVDTGIGIKSYVVKLYTADDATEKNRVVKEFIGNSIAGQFDFNVPECAFINFDENFKMLLTNEQLEQLEMADERLKFGCEYVEDFRKFQKDMQKGHIKKKIDIDSLFAFDSYIRNCDRGYHKPNVLITKRKIFLIDHEYSFTINPNTISNFNNFIWEDAYTKHHLFFNYLKKSNSKTRGYLFDTFREYLLNYNTNSLNEIFNALENQGYETNKIVICEYLNHIKNNCSKFVAILKNSLTH